jgi:ABC-type Fe3+/spermidine/putrescine transport system ATPase subunit
MADRIAVMNNGEVVQVASPFELYRNPQNTFVADFIGTSNLIKGTLTNSSFQLKNGMSVPCAHQSRSEEALWMLRPEEIVVSDNGIKATVVNSNFYGAHCLLLVECGLEKPLKLHVSSANVPPVGSELTISWTHDAGVILNES